MLDDLARTGHEQAAQPVDAKFFTRGELFCRQQPRLDQLK
jgi:hypothetical protein